MSKIRRPVLALLACVAAALAALAWMLNTNRALRQEAKDRFFRQYNLQQLLIAQQASRTIEEMFSTFRHNLAIVSSLFDGVEVTAERCSAVRSSLERIYRNVDDMPVIDLVVFDSAGDVVGIVPPDPYTMGRNYAWRKYFQWARDSGREGRIHLSPFMRMEGGQNRGDMALIVAMGIYGDGGRFKGVTTFTLNFGELARKQVLSIRLQRNGYAWLVDSTNEMVLVDPSGKIGSQSFQEAFRDRWPTLYRLLLETRKGEPGMDTYVFFDPEDETRSTEKLVGYAPVRIEDRLWTLGVSTPVPEVEALMESYLQRLETFSGVSITAVFAAAFLLSGVLLVWNRALKGEVAVRTRDLEQTTARLEDTFEQLLSARKVAAVGSLALGLAHEIRNPLSAIRVNMDFLQSKVPAEPRTKECFEIVEGEIQRLNALLGQVLSYAKPSPGRATAVDLAEVVRKVLTLLEARLEAAGVEIALEETESPATALCDEGQINQVLLNLVLNALDAMEDAERRGLRITVGRQEAMAFVRVEDTGPGIAEEDLSKIFDPFFTTKTNGVGLGLSITERIVNANGGSVSARNRSGQGAEFCVFLPTGEDRPIEDEA